MTHNPDCGCRHPECTDCYPPKPMPLIVALGDPAAGGTTAIVAMVLVLASVVLQWRAEG